MRFNSIGDAVRAYWRHEVYLTDLVMTLLTDFDTKIICLRADNCSLFDMADQEYLDVLRPASSLGSDEERRIKNSLETWVTSSTQPLLRQAAADVIDSASMEGVGIDLERSVFSLRVEHLAILPAE